MSFLEVVKSLIGKKKKKKAEMKCWEQTTVGSEPSVLRHPSACFIIFAGRGMLNTKLSDLVTWEVAACKQTGAAFTPMRCSGRPRGDNSPDKSGWIFWGLICFLWVCRSHGLAVRGFGQLVTSGKMMKIVGRLFESNKKPFLLYWHSFTLIRTSNNAVLLCGTPWCSVLRSSSPDSAAPRGSFAASFSS